MGEMMVRGKRVKKDETTYPTKKTHKDWKSDSPSSIITKTVMTPQIGGKCLWYNYKNPTSKRWLCGTWVHTTTFLEQQWLRLSELLEWETINRVALHDQLDLFNKDTDRLTR